MKTRAASDPKAILRARALALARPLEPAPAAGSFIDVLEFSLAGERYAVELPYIGEAVPFQELTPLPSTPPFVLGIVNVRGRILPVIDLKKFFGLPEQGLTDLHRIILVRSADLEFGLLADAVVGLRSVARASLQPTLPTLSGIRADYLMGVTADRLVVLDLARILEDPRIVVQDEIEN